LGKSVNDELYKVGLTIVPLPEVISHKPVPGDGFAAGKVYTLPHTLAVEGRETVKLLFVIETASKLFVQIPLLSVQVKVFTPLLKLVTVVLYKVLSVISAVGVL
jgi:hypothetical protein